MTGFDAKGPATLAPHPWDQFGTPPPLDLVYPDAVVAEGGLDPIVADNAVKAAALLREADEYRGEAEEAERNANQRETDANALLATFEDDHPKLAQAIENDLDSVTDRDSATLAWRGA